MVALELVPTMLVGLARGRRDRRVRRSSGVPDGVRGIPLVVPAAVAVGLPLGAALLGFMTGAVATRIALRVSPASAMRAQE